MLNDKATKNKDKATVYYRLRRCLPPLRCRLPPLRFFSATSVNELKQCQGLGLCQHYIWLNSIK
jgi:hypothetical protein